MNMKQFLEEIEKWTPEFSSEALEFYNNLKKANSKIVITANGKKILEAMLQNKKLYMNIYTSKQLGEILFMPPRSVSGAMRKLVLDQYVSKKAGNPIAYSITEAGEALLKELNIDKD